MKWIADKNARPPLHHELKAGRKTVALVRRVNARKTKTGYRHSYQLVREWVGIMGVARGPVFPTLAAAKRQAEQEAR